jgi:hypothetical protein
MLRRFVALSSTKKGTGGPKRRLVVVRRRNRSVATGGPWGQARPAGGRPHREPAHPAAPAGRRAGRGIGHRASPWRMGLHRRAAMLDTGLSKPPVPTKGRGLSDVTLRTDPTTASCVSKTERASVGLRICSLCSAEARLRSRRRRLAADPRREVTAQSLCPGLRVKPPEPAHRHGDAQREQAPRQCPSPASRRHATRRRSAFIRSPFRQGRKRFPFWWTGEHRKPQASNLG